MFYKLQPFLMEDHDKVILYINYLLADGLAV